jgi:hypothetical protein
MNLGLKKQGVILVAVACLIMGGAWAASAGPAPDADSDGVADASDNCTDISNTSQIDTNSDGYGNICDADWNNNGGTGAGDLAELKLNFGLTDADGSWNPDLDTNDNQGIGAGDLSNLKLHFGDPPGPGCGGSC